ncbi:CheC-like protein [Desulfitobacterium hafniense]|uniref:CheC-like protein n=1 Tax=Desulfitobacterium hafniense TaxID=49338 RepID=A0A098B2W8_DESHA|nr:CheC-like protein [Desulfitobacterium hafniense]
MGGVSNYLHINLDYSLPEVKIFNKKDFARDIKSNENYSRNMILLYITFIIDETEIDGAIMINLTLTSLQELMSKIEKIEVELNE